MNRRDLLKLFGAGAIVAPVIGGLATNITAQARIIKQPEIELIEPLAIEICEELPFTRIMKISVDIVDELGERYHMDCAGIREETLAIGEKWVTSLKLITDAPKYLRIRR